MKGYLVENAVRRVEQHQLIISPYDLLLRKKRPGDPEDGEYRPDEFRTGSREFDPRKVGFRSSGFGSEDLSKRDGTRFLTELPANSNAGHEYGNFGPEERDDLVEYMKTL